MSADRKLKISYASGKKCTGVAQPHDPYCNTCKGFMSGAEWADANPVTCTQNAEKAADGMIRARGVPHRNDLRDMYLLARKGMVPASELHDAEDRAEEWNRIAHQWMEDYDRLKAKYEPITIAPSEAVGG